MKATFRPVYLDYQATTPTDKNVVEAMLPYFTEKPGNPHSTAHLFGWEAEAAVDVARGQVAKVINAKQEDIIFTSGATESNNLAIKGIAQFYGRFSPSPRKHIITVVTEHKCVLESCRFMESEGWRITYLPVEKNGLLDMEKLEGAMDADTVLVSVMAVNNEIGVIQPFAEIGHLCRSRGIFFHTDAAQAFGKIPLDVEACHIDALSISGHKIYGPKGIGALYLRSRPKVMLLPQIHGGGQEKGMRSGTVPTTLVVGLGKASQIAENCMGEESERIRRLAERMANGLLAIPGTTINGDRKARIPGNINVQFSGIDGALLLASLKTIAVSAGSACASSSMEPSYVLSSIGLSREQAKASLRIGIGRYTTQEEVDGALDNIRENVHKLSRASA